MGVRIRKFLSRQKNRLLYAGAMVMLCFTWAGFVFSPLTLDLKVFLASSNQSDYISKDLIVGAFKAWELKSVFSRTLMYLIYKIACLFTDFGTRPFETACKVIYSLMILGASWLAMRLLFGKSKTKVNLLSLVTSSLFFAVHTSCQMQVEMSTAMIILLAYALYVNAVRTDKNTVVKLLGAGALIGSVFFFKSVLLLLSVTVVCAVCIFLTEKRQKLSFVRLLTVVAGSVVMLSVIMLLILFINPAEIQDMINASHFQQPFYKYDVSIKHIMVHTWFGMEYLPVVFAGAFALLFNLTTILFGKGKSKKRLVFFHVAMWLMPELFVIISYKFYPYHFGSMIFPALVELYYTAKTCLYLAGKKGSTRVIERYHLPEAAACAGAVFFAAWYVLLISVLSPSFALYNSENDRAYRLTEKTLSSLDIDKQEAVLYLDEGLGAYHLGNRSYLKYYFPLPLQKLPEDSQLPCFTESYDAFMKYEGEYISVYEDWFFVGGRCPELRQYIDDHYEYAASYYVYVQEFTLRQKGINDLVEYKLYRRKATSGQANEADNIK